MAGETVLNLFVSSPGDVQRERERVDFVVERLNAEYAGRARIRVIRWETRFYSSHETFQAQIPEAAECDLVLAIFGARLGSPLPDAFPRMPTGEPYPSGSAYEVLSAIEARRGRGTPDVYVFRRPSAPSVTLDAADREDIEAQWRRLQRFFETWFRNPSGQFIAAFQEFATTDEFAARIEDCLRQWLTRRGFPANAETWDRRKLGSPYPGLAAFDEQRRLVFFGRSLVIDQAIRRMRELQTPVEHGDRAPFLLIIGASGSGKSSLVAAGLMPRIGQPGVVPEIDLWRRAIVTPGVDPFQSLADALLQPGAIGEELARGAFGGRELLARQLAGDPQTALAPLRQALTMAAETRARDAGFETPRAARLCLAVDQAERIFAENPPEIQTRFARLLSALCRQGLATVIFVLRSDAYPRFQAIPDLVALRDAGATLDLLPATANELEEMATRPAALCDPPLSFEIRDGRSLAAALVADARGGDALPLLQMTLARLSQAEAARGDGVLRFADYNGLAAAVTETAREALAAVDESARAQLPRMITGLVRDVASDPVTGAITPVIGALDRESFEQGRPERAALIDAFISKRLLTAEGDAGSQRVRPTHESLLRIWPEAVRIVAETAHLIRVREALAPIVRDWAEAPDAEKTRHLDISPALLDGAGAYIERFGDEASPQTRAFVSAAIAAADARRARERQEQERRIADAQAIAAANRRIARTTGAGLVAALALAGVAGFMWRSADIARNDAQAQRTRAENSLAAATQTANALVFDLAQKFSTTTGVPKAVVKDILDKARGLQEQLLASGETSAKLEDNHAAALAQIAGLEDRMGDADDALTLYGQARDIYQKLLDASPGAPKTVHNLALVDHFIGTLLVKQGKLDDAQKAFDNARTAIDDASKGNAIDPMVLSSRAESFEDLGQLARTRGDGEKALGLFREELKVAEGIAAGAPDDIPSRNGLAVAHRNIGDVLLEQGRTAQAVAEFDAGAAITGKLADDNPDNSALRRDHGVSLERLGDARAAQGDFAGALKAYSDGQALSVALAASDAADLEWRFDISTGDIEIGDMKSKLGDAAGALAAYQDSERIDADLVARDASKNTWRRHHAASLQRVGDALLSSDPAAALKDYEQSLALSESIGADQPDDADWKSEIALAHRKIGDGQQAFGKIEAAIQAFRDAIDVWRPLVTRADARSHWLDQDWSAMTALGGMLRDHGEGAAAVAAERDGLDLARQGASRFPADPTWQMHVINSDIRIANALMVGGDDDGAIAAFKSALADAEASAGNPRASSASIPALTGLGAIFSLRGDADNALDAYAKAESALRLAIAGDPAGIVARGQLALVRISESHMLTRAGRADDAVAALREAGDLAAGLAHDLPDDASWPRQQAVAQSRLGDVLGAKGDIDGALAAWRAALALIAAPPLSTLHDMGLQLEVAQTQEAIARSLGARNDTAGAVAALRAAIEARTSLAQANPDDATNKRTWMVDDNILGRHLSTANDPAAALAAYRDGLVLARELAARPNAAAVARSDLSISLFLVGLTLMQAGDSAGATAILAEGLPIAKAIAAADAANPQGWRQVFIFGVNLGDLQLGANNIAAARDSYLAARDAALAITGLNASDQNAQSQLTLAVGKIGMLANAVLLTRDFEGALKLLDLATPMKPELNWLDLVRAACLMFLGRDDEARALYIKHRGEATLGKTWEAAAVDGFANLRAKGLDNPLMDEVAASFASH